MERLGLRFGNRPEYSREQVQAAWRAFRRAPHGQVILDLLLHHVFLRRKDEGRDLGQEDLALWMVAQIQQAEEGYGDPNEREPEQPPTEWWFPRP